MSRTAPVRFALALALSVAGCAWFQKTFTPSSSGGTSKTIPRPVSIKSFSDAAAVNAVLGSGNVLWVGTARGLIRWDLETRAATRITSSDGLPGNRVSALLLDGNGALWVATAGGLAHEVKAPEVKGKPAAPAKAADAKLSWKKFPNPPVGESVTAMARSNDGTLWFAGSTGLVHLLKTGKYDRLLGASTITALATVGDDAWVGTAKRGLCHLGGDKMECYGPEQGSEIVQVRSLTANQNGLIAVGEGKGGQRIAYYDGFRFHSYKVEGFGDTAIEWVRHIGENTVIAVGSRLYVLGRVDKAPDGEPPSLRLVPVPLEHPKAPASVSSHAEPPDPSAPPSPLQPRPSPTGPGAKDAAKPAVAAAESAEAPAVWTVKDFGLGLPDQVTAVGPDGPTLFVGTRFLGASKVEPDQLTHLRLFDLTEGAERLSVACESEHECWVATGNASAWHFDGSGFEASEVDTEKGSRVLAVVEPPHGSPMAIHSGSADNILRFSSVSEGRWTPIGFHELAVPAGVPDVTFAVYAPTKRLWVGLRYVDKDGDRMDYGAAEIDLDRGRTTYHRQVGVMAERDPSVGYSLPNDIESAFFRGADEGWFGTRSGAVQVKAGVARVFTENDGLESEIIHGLVEGPDGNIWVATARGVGYFDGAHWSFPIQGDELKVKATAIARDRFGAAFVGSRSGLLLCGPPPNQSAQRYSLQKLDAHRGLLDDHVIALAVDKYGRVWVLTEKGISVVSR